MLDHDFQETQGHSAEIGSNPHEMVMLLRCKWCNRPPVKARQDGCPVRELKTSGRIRLDEWNPEGVEHFKGRKCVTCESPIMEHFLHDESPYYWCPGWVDTFSEGIDDCVWDVEGVTAPRERPKQ